MCCGSKRPASTSKFFNFFYFLLNVMELNSNANANSNEMTKYLENCLLQILFFYFHFQRWWVPFDYLISKPSLSGGTPRVENPIEMVSPKGDSIEIPYYHALRVFFLSLVDDVALFSTVSMFLKLHSFLCCAIPTACPFEPTRHTNTISEKGSNWRRLIGLGLWWKVCVSENNSSILEIEFSTNFLKPSSY